MQYFKDPLQVVNTMMPFHINCLEQIEHFKKVVSDTHQDENMKQCWAYL